MPNAILRPSAVGVADNWNLAAGASKVAAIDPGAGLAHDDDTTYIRSLLAPGANADQAFVMDTGLPVVRMTQINSLQVNTRVRSESPPAGELYLHWIRRGSTDGGTASGSPPGSYTDFTTSSYARPGGGSWVPADFVPGNIQLRVSSEDTAAVRWRVTSGWLVLNYEAAKGGFVNALWSLLPLFGSGLLLREVAEAVRQARPRLILSPDEVRAAWRELREDPRRVYA
jgi:hypothetical protein